MFWTVSSWLADALSTQLAANILTLTAMIGGFFFYRSQTRHANHVRDLQFIATQRNLISSLGRHVVPENERETYDANELLAALEETAHAFNVGLVGRVAVDYLKPQFNDIICWALSRPVVNRRWSEVKDEKVFTHLSRYIADENIRCG